MKKRIFALATALVMTLSMGMTALAAQSPEVDDTSSNQEVTGWAESATAVIDGQVVELEFTYSALELWEEVTEAQLEQIKYYMPATSEEKSARTRDLFEQVMGYRSENVIYNDYFGLALPAGYTMPEEGVEVTINAPYAGKGDSYSYFIFHCKADGTWEYIPTTEGNGILSGKFTSFSPVFIMRVPREEVRTITSTPENPETNKNVTVENQEIEQVTVENSVIVENSETTQKPVTEATTTTNTTVTTKAPKTGETTGIYVAGLLSVISAAGIVVYTKREKIEK